MILSLVVLVAGLRAGRSGADDGKAPRVSEEPLPGVFACHESIPHLIEASPPLAVETATSLGISRVAAQAWRKSGWWFSATPPDAAPDAGPREVYVDPSGKVRIGTRRVTVSLRSKSDLGATHVASLESELGAKVLYASPDTPVVVVRVPVGRNPYRFAEELSGRASVAGVNVTTLSLAHGSSAGCDDSATGHDAWHLKAESSGIDAGVRDAWEAYGVSGAGRIVAVIDFDFLTDHEDLRPDLAVSRKFVENGYRQVIDVVEVQSSDADPHGTMVAGVIGAIRGNGKGVCGVAPEAALRLISVQKGLCDEAMWRSINFARNPATEIPGFTGRGADVVSSSVHYTGEPPGFEMDWDSIADAIGRLCTEGRGGLGAPFIWALSNPDVLADEFTDRIASFPYVISIGATTMGDEWLGGGFGPLVDLVAPGQEIMSTGSNSTSDYRADQGCSFAAPIVAGVAALVIERNPNLTMQQVWQAMRCSAKRLGDRSECDRFGHHPKFGWGRINALGAVGLANAPPNPLCIRLWQDRRLELIEKGIFRYPRPLPDPPLRLPPRGTCPGLGEQPIPQPPHGDPVREPMPVR